jgi:hypothetical protein
VRIGKGQLDQDRTERRVFYKCSEFIGFWALSIAQCSRS